MSYSTPQPGTASPATPAVVPQLTGPATSPGFTGYTTHTFRDTRLGRSLTRLFRVCSSMQLAIVSLSLFTVCLAMATFLESAYSARIAGDLVYRTWWFSTLLVFLAINVLCAALKKFPWKRHQIGFLVTHAGLLVLLFGGMLTNLGGVDGQMSVIDTDNREIQQAYRFANQADTIQLADQHQIEVLRVPKHRALEDSKLLQDLLEVVQGGLEPGDSLKNKLENNIWNLRLSPGSFAWRADEHFTPRLPWTVNILSTLATPSPGFSAKLDEKTTLKVENYYPHTESRPFSPAKDDEEGFPALMLKLQTPMAPRPFTRWVTSLPRFEPDPSPLAFEMLILTDPALLPEFLSPPATAELVLAIGEHSTICRVPLDKVKVGQTIPLEKTDLKFTLKATGNLIDLMGGRHEGEKPEFEPQFPAVKFDLEGPKGKAVYVACARLPHLEPFQPSQQTPSAGKPLAQPAMVSAWYHHPDFRWGEKHRMGAFQFLLAPGGKLYYRVFGKDGLKEKGRELDPSDTTTLHETPLKPMDMKFQVVGWLPRAVREEQVIPRHVRPGSEPSERLEPALRCTLDCNGEKKEFWVRMGRLAQQVVAGREMYFIRYRPDSRRLDFSLKLNKAQQVSDPGTNRPASYQSDVVLAWQDKGERKTRDFSISMNNTLDHAGFKVYQTNYRPLSDPRSGEMVLDEKGKLVSLSGFTVADDPGLLFKYLGSLLLVLGIATMFWMRAYFFKPRSAAA